MDVRLDKKVTVITGATKGIGLSIARVFGMEGAKVAICGRNEQFLRQALENLESEGVEAVGLAADASDEAQLRSFADFAEQRFGGIDIWINNAGIYPQAKITEMSVAQWDEVFDVNVRSVFIGSKIAKEKLKKRGGGVLFNASSFAAVIPSVTSGAYAATKSAIYSMTKTLAAELAPLGIRVIGYIPGLIETDMTRAIIETGGSGVYSQLALHSIGHAEDVAYPLLFLASDYASYITGTFIEISGGKYCVQNPLQAWN